MEKPKKEPRKMEKKPHTEFVRTNEEVIMPINGVDVLDRVLDRFESMSSEMRDQYRFSTASQDKGFKVFPDGAFEVTPAKFQVVIEKRDKGNKDIN